jgi:1-aminocyclopropane-1-carboxylate deaminase
MNLPLIPPLQELSDSLLLQKKIRVFILREDLIHPYISGNKWRKLYYNIQEAKLKEAEKLITFGGAYSNHIAATASAGKEFGFKTIGFIRGEEQLPLNSTLSYAKSCGMEFRYLSRTDYRLKEDAEFLNSILKNEKEYYLIPEGGTNELAVKGCEEITADLRVDFDYICCAVGTGGTISGIINSLKKHQKAIGFPALKGGDFLKVEIAKYTTNRQWELNLEYHFGGYAKVKPELINFMNSFKAQHQIALDPVYTAKMLFGLWDLIEKDYFRAGSTIIVVHTGGLQGIEGMNERLKNKGLQIL